MKIIIDRPPPDALPVYYSDPEFINIYYVYDKKWNKNKNNRFIVPTFQISAEDDVKNGFRLLSNLKQQLLAPLNGIPDSGTVLCVFKCEWYSADLYNNFRINMEIGFAYSETGFDDCISDNSYGYINLLHSTVTEVLEKSPLFDFTEEGKFKNLLL